MLANFRAASVAISLQNVHALDLDPDPAAAHSRVSGQQSQLGKWSVATEEDERPQELVWIDSWLAPNHRKGPDAAGRGHVGRVLHLWIAAADTLGQCLPRYGLH